MLAVVGVVSLKMKSSSSGHRKLANCCSESEMLSIL